MSTYRLAVMNGDGIGPEVVPAAVDVLTKASDEAGVGVNWVELPMGWQAIEEHGDPMPPITKEALERCDGWVMGPHDSASYPETWHRQRRPLPGGEVRRDFDLYANIRPAVNLPGVAAHFSDVDLVIYRENTEGTYVDRSMHIGHGEFMPSPDLALAVGVYKREAVNRIVRDAFEAARRRKGHLTVVHKANVLALTTGMYLEEARQLTTEFCDIVVDDFHVDAMAALLVRHPSTFDVIVSDNLFGDILSDLAGELVGGIGLGPGLNAGGEHAMAQAVHGSAPDIAGKNRANPIGIIASTSMLFRWLGERRGDHDAVRAADLADEAVRMTLEAGYSTPDLGGNSSTSQFVSEIVARVGSR